MYPRVQLRINDRVVIDSKDFVSEVENSILTFRLEDSDTFPTVVDSELVTVGGWKLNVVSIIHSKANSKTVIKGWESLGRLVPMDRLLSPFLYSTAIDYVRLRFSGVEPSWAGLLRLCYWYERSLDLHDENFHYKQTEIKRKILRPLRNTEKTINNKGMAFIPTMEQLRKEISSYISELQFAVLSNECDNRISFHMKHDFVIDIFPCEVKSIYSRMTVERKKNKAQLKVHGQVLGEKVNPYEEFFKFIFSRKVLGHLQKAHSQGGKIVFLDATHTFASHLMYLLSIEKGTNFSFCKALDIAIGIAKNTKEKVPIVIVSSASSYEHQTMAFVVPMPSKLFNN